MFLLSKAQIWLHLVLGDNANHLCPVYLLTDWFGILLLFIFSRLNPIGFVYGKLPISLWWCLLILQMLTGNTFLWRMVSLELIFSFVFLFYDFLFKWWLFFIYENLEIIHVLWKLRSFFQLIHIYAIRLSLQNSLPGIYASFCFIIYKYMLTTLLIGIYRGGGEIFPEVVSL